MTDRCLSAIRIYCPVFVSPGSICLDSVCSQDSDWILSKKLSVCPAGQGRGRAVRTFGVLVGRRLLTGQLKPFNIVSLWKVIHALKWFRSPSVQFSFI